MRWCLLLAVVACGSTPVATPKTTVEPAKPVAAPPPPVAEAPIAEAQLPAVETPPPTRDEQCAEAIRTVAAGDAVEPVAREAQDFTVTPAERKAIGRAAKADSALFYGGKEARAVAAAYEEWINEGANFEVMQAMQLKDRRVVVISYTLTSGPTIDRGPHLQVVASEPKARTWRVITGAHFDPDARIVGTVDGDLLFEKQRAPGGDIEVWRVSLKKPTGPRPELEPIKKTARC